MDLSQDDAIQVHISDALNEQDVVKFTIHTKASHALASSSTLTFTLQTTLPSFAKPEFEVIRQHEEFVWLSERFAENDTYAGYIVRPRTRLHDDDVTCTQLPPCPLKPDFSQSHGKLAKLQAGVSLKSLIDESLKINHHDDKHHSTLSQFIFKHTINIITQFLYTLPHTGDANTAHEDLEKLKQEIQGSVQRRHIVKWAHTPTASIWPHSKRR